MADADVVYHGYQRKAGGSVIAIEDPGGATIGVVRHVVKHSPTGMGWGYAGSGAADCARSVLIAALGAAAGCQMCAGTGKVVYRPDDGEEPPPAAYDPATSHGEYERDGFEISGCWQWDCDEGYRRLPYQQFKIDFVVGWDGEWRMSRRDILRWLDRHGVHGPETDPADQ